MGRSFQTNKEGKEPPPVNTAAAGRAIAAHLHRGTRRLAADERPPTDARGPMQRADGDGIVDLATADPIIAMQVLRYGRPLLVRDRAAFEAFRMTTPSRYFDWKVSRRPIEDGIWAGAGAR